MKNEDFLKQLANTYAEESGKMYKQENADIAPAPIPALDKKMRSARRIQKWKTHRRTVMSIAASVIVLVVFGIALLPGILQDGSPFYTTDNERLHFGTGGAANDSAVTQAAPPPAPEASSPDAAPGAADTPESSEYWHFFEAETDDSHWFDGTPGTPQLDMTEETQATPGEDTEALWDSAPQPSVPPAPSLAPISLTPPPGWRIAYTDFDGDITIFHLEGEGQNHVVVMAVTPPESNDFSQFFPVLINTTWAYMRIESTHSVLIYEMDGVQFTLTTAYDHEDLIVLAYSWL